MVGFIDLILSNPLLLFFAIAMLLNIFGSSGNKKENEKGKQQGRQQAPKSPTREARKTNKTEEIDWRDIFRQGTSPFFEVEEPTRPTASRQIEERKIAPIEVETVSIHTDEVLSQGNTALQEQYERLKMKQKQTNKQVSAMNNSPIYTGEISKNTPNKLNLNFNHVSQDEIVKGIIWSEILSKPKAKSS